MCDFNNFKIGNRYTFKGIGFVCQFCTTSFNIFSLAIYHGHAEKGSNRYDIFRPVREVFCPYCGENIHTIANQCRDISPARLNTPII